MGSERRVANSGSAGERRRLFVGDLVGKKSGVITFFFVLLCSAGLGQQTYDAHLAQAKSLIMQQRYADAVTEAQKAITTDGQRWEAYAVAAKAYSGQKLYDDAIGMLQIALARSPEDKKPLVRDAIAECRKQIQDKASGLLGATPTSNPASANASTSLATATPSPTQAEIVLWKTKENSQKQADFEGYLQQYPMGVFSTLAKNRLREFQGQTEELKGNAWRTAIIFEGKPGEGDARVTVSPAGLTFAPDTDGHSEASYVPCSEPSCEGFFSVPCADLSWHTTKLKTATTLIDTHENIITPPDLFVMESKSTGKSVTVLPMFGRSHNIEGFYDEDSFTAALDKYCIGK
jgi:hypothetical protein